MKTKKINQIYKGNKKIIASIIVMVILLLFLSEIFLFYEKINSEDINFDEIIWALGCDGRDYTIEEMNLFCGECLNGSGKCGWPLDMNISINKLKRVIRTGGSVHCYFIFDGINEYYELGRYYGITESPFFTWQVLYADKNHEVELCCGIERNTFLYSLFGLEKKWPQSCIKKNVEKKCR